MDLLFGMILEVQWKFDKNLKDFVRCKIRVRRGGNFGIFWVKLDALVGEFWMEECLKRFLIDLIVKILSRKQEWVLSKRKVMEGLNCNNKKFEELNFLRKLLRGQNHTLAIVEGLKV